VRPGRTELATEAAVSYVTGIIDHHHRPVVVNLTGLRFCDTRGLSALLRMASYAKQAGCPFMLASPNPSLIKLMRITGLDRRLTPSQRSQMPSSPWMNHAQCQQPMRFSPRSSHLTKREHNRILLMTTWLEWHTHFLKLLKMSTTTPQSLNKMPGAATTCLLLLRPSRLLPAAPCRWGVGTHSRSWSGSNPGIQMAAG
jgi:anti-anti-sigma factor